MDILKEAKAVQQYVVQLRRHIHINPEVSDKENNTIAFISEELTKLSIEHTVVEQGGIIGYIDGATEGKTILLRADVDALPMQENSKNAKGSKVVVSSVDGAAHTCGHDAHTAMLLGAAKIISENKDKLSGRALLFFERGEEGTGNIYYLLKYIQENNIKIDGCWGIHVHANVGSGKMVIPTGPTLAGAMGFNITIQGKGGHGARPDLSTNPIDCYVAIHMAVNQLRIRTFNAFHPLSYSICLVDGGTKGNIIPDKVRFEGSCRFYDKQDAIRFREELRKIVDNTCKLYHCEPFYEQLNIGILPVINNADCADIARESLTKILGLENLVEFEPKMGSESFSYLSTYYPSVFAQLGVRNEEKGMVADTHNPQFDPDEDSFVNGVASTVAYTIAFLKDTRHISFDPFLGSVDEFKAQIDE